MKKFISVLLVAALLTVSLSSCSRFAFVFEQIFDKFGNNSEYSDEGVPDDNVESVTLSQTELNLNVGDSLVIYADVLPEDFDVAYLDWMSGDDSIAYVENGNTDNGTIVAVGTGRTVITVMAPNGVCGYCNVTVSDKEIESITLNYFTTSIKVGESLQLETNIEPVDAVVNLIWYSSDESVAVVNSEGLVTGVNGGVTSITCVAPNGMEATCTVTVTDTNQNSSFSISGDSQDIFPDSSSRYLSESEVAGITPSQAQMAINEIYARHGYIFKSDEISQYFKSKPWYSPNPNFSENDFTAIEKYNMNIIKKYRD